jgi:hypothetical protein
LRDEGCLALKSSEKKPAIDRERSTRETQRDPEPRIEPSGAPDRQAA